MGFLSGNLHLASFTITRSLQRSFALMGLMLVCRMGPPLNDPLNPWLGQHKVQSLHIFFCVHPTIQQPRPHGTKVSTGCKVIFLPILINDRHRDSGHAFNNPVHLLVVGFKYCVNPNLHGLVCRICKVLKLQTVLKVASGSICFISIPPGSTKWENPINHNKVLNHKS